MLPGIRRPTKAQYLDEAYKLLARFAMGAVDGDRRGTRFAPTALNAATRFGNSVGEAVDDPELGPEYSGTFGQGATVEELFAGAAARLEEDLVEAGHEVLAEFYLRIRDDLAALAADQGTPPTPKQISETVAEVLVRDYQPADADGDGYSLWILFMQACYPNSGHLKAALGGGGKTDSQVNPFAPWESVPGTF